MKLTKITSTNPSRVSKVITNNDGKLEKDSIAFIIGGHAKIDEVDFYNLDGYLNNLGQNEIVCLGTPPGDGDIKTKKAISGGETGFSRSKNFFKFSKGYLLFDIDDISQGETVDTMMSKLYALDPKLEKSRHLVRYSSSSWIYDTEGVELQGLRGMHVFYPVEDYTGLDNYVTSLKDKAWELDLGIFKISSAGHKLERFSCFDASVFSPERLIFETKPLTKNCEQQCPPSRTIAGNGVEDYLNLGVVKLNKLERDQSKLNFKKSRALITKEADKIRESFYKELWGTRYDSEIKLSRKRAVEALIDDVWLPADFMIDTERGLMEAGMLWMNQDLDDVTCEDPFRGLNVGTAKFSWDETKPYVFSFRGMVKYFIEKPPRSWMIRHGFEVEEVQDLLVLDKIEDLNIKYMNKHLEYFAECVNIELAKFVNFRGKYYSMNSSSDYSANDVSSTIMAIVSSKHTWDIADQFVDPKTENLVTVPISYDQRDAIKRAVVAGVPEIDEIIYRSTYEIDKFIIEHKNDKLVFVKPANKPIMPETDKLSNHQEIVDWYLTDKFPELGMFVVDIVAGLFNVNSKTSKSYLKLLQMISNGGKTELVSKLFEDLGVCYTMSAMNFLQMTGVVQGVSGDSPRKLLAPLVVFDEVANLSFKHQELFLEAMKELTHGLALNAKNEKNMTVVGNQALMMAAMDFEALDVPHSEHVNRLIRLDNGRNEIFDLDGKYSLRDVQHTMQWFVYEQWMFVYNTLKPMTANERVVWVDSILSYGYKPALVLQNTAHEPWKYLMSQLAVVYDSIGHDLTQDWKYANPDKKIDGVMFYKAPHQSRGSHPGYVVIKARHKFMNLLFENSGLTRGVSDSIKKLLESVMEQPKNKQFGFKLNVNDWQGNPSVLTTNGVYRLQVPVFDQVNYDRLRMMSSEDVYEEFVAYPSNFKDHWPDYAMALAE